MRVIHVSEYEHERMQLGKPILDQKGRTLLAAGSRVNPRFLERLMQMGILSLMSAHIAFQHHETFDGKGFPRGISGTKVLEYAQICGIANTFDHLVSQKHIPPHEAIEYIMALSNKDFQPKVVEAFIHSTPAYPPGKKVLLNDDTEAIVVRIDQHMQRPVVRKMESNEEISLADHPNMTIKHEVESRFRSYENV